METFSALLSICAGNSPVTGEFPAQRPVTRSFDVFFDLRLIKRLSKQSWGWWFETPWRPLWRHCNVHRIMFPWEKPSPVERRGPYQWHFCYIIHLSMSPMIILSWDTNLTVLAHPSAGTVLTTGVTCVLEKNYFAVDISHSSRVDMTCQTPILSQHYTCIVEKFKCNKFHPRRSPMSTTKTDYKESRPHVLWQYKNWVQNGLFKMKMIGKLYHHTGGNWFVDGTRSNKCMKLPLNILWVCQEDMMYFSTHSRRRITAVCVNSKSIYKGSDNHPPNTSYQIIFLINP